MLRVARHSLRSTTTVTNLLTRCWCSEAARGNEDTNAVGAWRDDEIEGLATGIQVLKQGSDPPILKEDAYPSWLYVLVTKEPTLKELERKVAASGADALSEYELKRAVKLERRRDIKDANAAASA